MHKNLVCWLVVHNFFKSVLPFLFGVIVGMIVHGNKIAESIIEEYWGPVLIVSAVVVASTLLLLYLEGEFLSEDK